MQQNLEYIQTQAQNLQAENDAFISFLKQQSSTQIDEKVTTLEQEITPQISCIDCGNCCKTLMINVQEPEAIALSEHLQLPLEKFKEQYIETGSSGMQLVSAIPCHFLQGTKCSVYNFRFSGCKEFPGLHLPNFTQRLFTVFMHYSRCPIIFNVIETLKIETGFMQ